MTAAKTSLTGSPLTDAVIDAAVQLVSAVRDNEGIEEAIFAAHAAAARVDGLAAHDDSGVISARALAVVLAAMVPDDRQPSDLLAWLRHPDEYRRLRDAGFDADTSAALAAEYAESGLASGGGG